MATNSPFRDGFPCIFPADQGFGRRDGFAHDWPLHHPVWLSYMLCQTSQKSRGLPPLCKVPGVKETSVSAECPWHFAESLCRPVARSTASMWWHVQLSGRRRRVRLWLHKKIGAGPAGRNSAQPCAMADAGEWARERTAVAGTKCRIHHNDAFSSDPSAKPLCALGPHGPHARMEGRNIAGQLSLPQREGDIFGII